MHNFAMDMNWILAPVIPRRQWPRIHFKEKRAITWDEHLRIIDREPEAGKPRIYYFPYRTIGKWNWSMGTPENLEIQVGGIQLTISGSGLRRLAEALNGGQLRLVQHSPLSDVGGEIRIRSILIQDLKN